VRQLETFAGQTTLDVPGRPVALPVPGHTAGSTAFLFPDHNVLFTGDALVTADTVAGHVGPCLIGPAFTQDSAAAVDALDILAATGADTVLTGHGEPWSHGVAAAAEQARKRVHRTGP
jgi:glyoxylase-like metal-dependent hydrolase (beta-lactamase superfamily II)